MLNMKTETDLKKEAEAGLKIRIDFSLLIHSFNQIHVFRLSFNQIQIHVVRVRRIEYFEIYKGRFRYRRDVKLK